VWKLASCSKLCRLGHSCLPSSSNSPPFINSKKGPNTLKPKTPFFQFLDLETRSDTDIAKSRDNLPDVGPGIVRYLSSLFLFLKRFLSDDWARGLGMTMDEKKSITT
jgi:hypothetical protein